MMIYTSKRLGSYLPWSPSLFRLLRSVFLDSVCKRTLPSYLLFSSWSPPPPPTSPYPSSLYSICLSDDIRGEIKYASFFSVLLSLQHITLLYGVCQFNQYLCFFSFRNSSLTANMKMLSFFMFTCLAASGKIRCIVR